MARWAAFVGLTGVVISILLALARLTQDTVGDGAVDPEGVGAIAGPSTRNPRPGDPVIPRFDDPGPIEMELSTGALLANVALTQGLFGTVLAAGAFYFEIPARAVGIAADPLSTGVPAVAVGTAAGVALWIGNELAGLIAERAGVDYDESLRELLAPDDARGWVLLLGGVLPIIAVVEEFVFRAAAIGAIAAGLGVSPWPMAVVSSVAFGVAHGAQGRVGMVVTGGLGLALAALFVVTESLLAVAVAHYLVNALELTVHEGLGIDRPGG
ncbi:CPBP family intramembrane glutamic endopeptidase [Halomicrobium salinisoli]|uniref:CPBP family intramembrane glutamic endopeptidase n=1 Tax=Halomicrobium salinisoli TaxID=2878391 RepID=UPI001CF05C41|nr:CPBP family intramembrane glutamic endopeptidase [Halomicrobium salinisoli]